MADTLLLQGASDTCGAINIDDTAGLVAALKKCAEIEAGVGALINTYSCFHER